MARNNDTISFSMDGLKELDAGLSELSRATARNVARRALSAGGQPIADLASSLAPDDPATGAPDLHRSIIVSTKLSDRRGMKEWSDEMKKSGDSGAARSALIGARQAQIGNPVQMMFVGVTGRSNRYAHLQEFGWTNGMARPFLTPAWERMKMAAFEIIKATLQKEISKAAARAARKAAKLAAGK